MMKYVQAFITGFMEAWNAGLADADAVWNNVIAKIDAKYPKK